MDGRTDEWTDRRTNGRTDGWMEGRTLFYRTLPAEAGGPTSTTAVDPRHLKVEDVEQDFPNCPYVINRTCQNLMLIM